MSTKSKAIGAINALRPSRGGFRTATRAQGTNLVGLILGLMVAAIVVIAVFIPVVNDVIASANLTGSTATIVGLLPLFGALLLLVALARPLMART